MFNIEEVNFILSNAERDLKSVEERIEHIISNIAEDGVRLSKLKEARNRLEGITTKIKEALKEDEDE